MEVVHVVRQFKPSIGGLEDAVHNLCLHLSQMPDMSVRVVTLDRLFTDPGIVLPAHEIIEGIEVTRISYFGSSRYPIALGILKAVKSSDIIHVHAIDWFFDFLSITRFMHRKVLVASTHGGFFHTVFAAKMKKAFWQTVTRFSCKGYAAICASSENDAATFRTISPNNVVEIENGVNVEKWYNAGNAVAERRMIFIGRWSANKCIPTLIELTSELRKQGNDWQLVIAGLPSDENAESLNAHVRQHGLEDVVRIHTAPSEQDIKRLLASASYIVSASSYEGFGISIVEGLSAGLFPLLTSIPPFERILYQLSFGERIDVFDLPGSATAIERSHSNLTENTQSIRDQCMELAKQYAWSDVAKRFLNVYDEALKQ